ncbi:YiiX/YebB-like N1pC/P60 family cysteine hydrolase [Moheibacter stercoris]|uniref:Permuted papain-like amidase enzyme, YaeF/YiiX, C92 family n=1 Tax=Moheibacter stercoris TaxID=1628251 RepID=A0ABV2LT18_9FLAO
MKFNLLWTLLLVLSCQTTPQFHDLRNGDLLFIGESTGNLSKAISEVTQTHKKTNYSHMGIIEKEGSTYWFLHSNPKNGTERIPLEEYISTEKKHSSQIDVYRIKSDQEVDITSAIDEAKTLLGKPYNFTYILSDSAYYCSDFVYKAFSKDSIFKLNPMTFKNHGETEFHQGWIDYYQKWNLEIPEGELGCNPNGMASSEKLIKVGTL